MFTYKLKELFGSDVSPEVGEEELRVTYQLAADVTQNDEKTMHDLAREFDLPIEVVKSCKLNLSGASGHIVTLIMKDRKLHIMNLDSETLLHPEFHRELISHELSHLFRIVTGQNKETVDEEERLARADGEALAFNFGNEFRARFLATLENRDH